MRSGDSTKVKRKPVFNRPWLYSTRQVPPWKIRGCLQKLKTVYANPMKNWPKEQILHIKGQVRLPACIEKDNPCFRKDIILFLNFNSFKVCISIKEIILSICIMCSLRHFDILWNANIPKRLSDFRHNILVIGAEVQKF